MDSHSIRYVKMTHSPAFTAQEVAESAHIHGKEFAKTVIVKVDGDLAMVVLPANEKLDENLLATATNSKNVELASEKEFKDRFPKCETGAMPPFGVLYDMTTYLEESMTANEKITFNAGTHTELVQMATSDYLELVEPTILRVCKSYTA